jgi:hypothetical protein
MSKRLSALAALVALAGTACGFGTLSLEEVDPDAIPPNPTYSQDIAPMMDYYCVACHDAKGQIGAQGDDKRKAATPYGDDGGEGIDLTSFEGVVGEFEEVEETILERSMPPGAARRLTARDEAILFRWAEQGFAP